MYFDHAATSPLLPSVREGLLGELSHNGWGNPSSVHQSGRRASRLVEEAREEVAKALGADSRRVTFLSGATEANHAAILSWGRWAASMGKRSILANPLEHPSVMGALRELERRGHHLIWAGVGDHGAVTGGCWEDSLEDVGFAVCMAANNETGAIQPWQEWRRLGESRQIPVHVDATQWIGKWSHRDDLSGVGSFALSGHKLGAPTGVGVLVQEGPVTSEGWLGEGPQERGRRGGTENLLGILGLGMAVRSIHATGGHDMATYIVNELTQRGLAVPTIPAPHRIPGILHLRLPVRADLVVQRLDLQGISVSSGSACSSGSVKPSPVLLAMGWSPEDARKGLRISLGWTNTQEECVELVQVLAEVLEDLQGL